MNMITVLICLLFLKIRAHNFFDLTAGRDTSFSAPVEAHWAHTEGHPETTNFEDMLAEKC